MTRIASQPPESRGAARQRNAFLFDLSACTGCQACQVACSIENELAPEASWREVVTFNPEHHPGVPVFHLSLACNHCAEAPCMEHCPALAYHRDEATGAVLLDPDRCIGCKYCSWACPYDAPRYRPEQGVMSKCTFCHHRLTEGLEPACVTACPTTALGFGDLATVEGGVDRVPGFPAAGCGPSIRFFPLPEGRQVPEVLGAASAAEVALAYDEAGGWRPGEEPLRAVLERAARALRVGLRSVLAAPRPAVQHPEGTYPGPAMPPSKITLAAEWPLAAFTLLAAALAGMQSAAALGALALPPPLLPALGVLGMGLASLHLGRKLRAWRAVLNLRRSWLSREIFLYGLFVALTAAQAAAAALGLSASGLPQAAALVGLAALIAIDRVYDVLPRRTLYGFHSADTLLTGLLLAGLLTGSLPLAAAVASAKLGLYLWRKVHRHRRGRDPRPGWSLLRLAAGFALPLALGLADPGRWPLWALAGTAVGELVDRGELYAELEVPTPRRQAVLDLRALGRAD